MAIKPWGIALAACIGLCVKMPPANAGDEPAESIWGAWSEIGGYAADRASARRGELALWVPLLQDPRSIFFVDLRGKLFDEDQREGNAALGYRFMSESGWNPGIWIGLDRRYTAPGNALDQVSFGVEALSADWDIRVNGYVPLDDRVFISRTIGGDTAPDVDIIGDSIYFVRPGLITTDLYELAFWGVDAEIGYRVPLERFGDEIAPSIDAAGSRTHDLRIFLGGFYFDHEDFSGEVAGPRARAEWRIENIIEDCEGSRLTFETAWQHDEVRDHQFEGGVRLRIPLGAPASRHRLSAQTRRMTEGIKRDTDIIAQAKPEISVGAAPEPVEDAATGTDFDRVIIVENGDDLAASVTAAGSNALVVAMGGAVYSGPVIMQDGQTLLGGGGSLQLRGRTSGAIATYNAPGTMPTIQHGGDAVLTAGRNSHITAVTVDGQGAASDGIRLIAASGAVVVDHTRVQNADIGISVSGADADVMLESNIIEGISISSLMVLGPFARHGFMSGPLDLTVRNSVFIGNRPNTAFFVGATILSPASTGNVSIGTVSDDCVLTAFSGVRGRLSFTDGTSFGDGSC